MKEKKRMLYPLAAAIFLVIAVVAASAASTPGSTSDPLVTKSYVDQQIALLSARIGSSGSSTGTTGTTDGAAVEQLKTDVGDLTKFVIDALSDLQNLKGRMTTIENGFIVLEMKKGQKLLMGGGSEAILRSGQASALKGTSGTVVDVSAGADVAASANVPVQHLLVSARNDGRGMEIKSTTAYVIVRGAYTIQ